MGLRDVFVDSGAFFAFLVSNERLHKPAETCLRRLQAEQRQLITTDYILDESITLLKARGMSGIVPRLFDLMERSEHLVVEWIAEDRFFAARDFLLKHNDHDYSFTDCTSFVVMQELRIEDALTADRHFQEAGFRALLVSP